MGVGEWGANQGMGLFGFEIFDSGMFLCRKVWQVFFVWLDLSGDLRWDFFGYSKQSEVSW